MSNRFTRRRTSKREAGRDPMLSTVTNLFRTARDSSARSARGTGWRMQDVFLPGAEEELQPGTEFMGVRPLVGRARYVIAGLGVALFAWAAFAPLDSAIMAPGEIIVASHRKLIQHLDGGIVKDIDVQEGQKVAAGQTLLHLDPVQARTNLAQLEGQRDALEAEQARLVAERDGEDHITFPADLTARAQNPEVADAIQGEVRTFAARKQTLDKEIDILRQHNEENDSVVAGLNSELASVEEQKKLYARETASIQSLYDKGLATLPRLLTLQRQSAELGGERGQVVEKMAQTKLSSGENELQIENLRNQQLSDVVKDLRDSQKERFEILDKIAAARDVLTRLDVRAPVAGRVVGLDVHTPGGVIRPGETIMEIEPAHDALEVSARVRPQDAAGLYPGMTAKVSLTGYEARRLPTITGTVKTVSAGTLNDPRTGAPYFAIQVSIDRSQLKDYPDARLIAGMPVDVAVDTGSRTALDYLSEPITDVFRQGMREK
jgi:HlyD family type I secretion membrane fusion protein